MLLIWTAGFLTSWQSTKQIMYQNTSCIIPPNGPSKKVLMWTVNIVIILFYPIFLYLLILCYHKEQLVVSPHIHVIVLCFLFSHPALPFLVLTALVCNAFVIAPLNFSFLFLIMYIPTLSAFSPFCKICSLLHFLTYTNLNEFKYTTVALLTGHINPVPINSL